MNDARPMSKWEAVPVVWRDLLGMVIINTVIGLALFLLLHAGRVRGGSLIQHLIQNQIYSHSIGTICGLFIPPVAIRLSGRSPWIVWPFFVAYLIVVAGAGTFLAVTIHSLLGYIPPNAVSRVFFTNLGFTTFISLCIGIASLLIGQLNHRQHKTSVALKNQQIAREQAEKLAAEAQLESLQSRLQPHFLFNTINSILSLIREDPASAETMLERLSRLLRFSLETQQRSTVELGEELKLVDDYLLIEKARFGRRLRFSIEADGVPEGVVLPPYSIQTLVENSMKYVISARRDGGEIRVRAGMDNGTLILEVSDDGPGFSRDVLKPGHGLDTLERRLGLLFPGQGGMEIGPGAMVRLRIPSAAHAGEPR